METPARIVDECYVAPEAAGAVITPGRKALKTNSKAWKNGQ